MTAPHHRGVVDALVSGDVNSLLRSAAQLLIEGAGLDDRWIVVSFSKSAHAPIAQILAPYEVPELRAERLLQRGPLSLRTAPPREPSYLGVETLRSIEGDRLATLFPSGAFFVPVPSAGFATLSAPLAGAIFCGADPAAAPDPAVLLIAQLASSIALTRLAGAEADQRLHEQRLIALANDVSISRTRREACVAVLHHLHELIPYSAGVLYLLDQNPGRNEYLVYGASRNERSEKLYQSFYPREALGFTWAVAISQYPRAGSVGDVPSTARHTNDGALTHLRKVHEAWAVIPFISRGQTCAVAHIEGVHFGEGASSTDLEIMRRLSERIGTLLDQRLSRQADGDGARPSIQIIQRLYAFRGLLGPRRRAAFEDFVRHVLGEIEGVQELRSISPDRAVPQVDGLFLIKDRADLVIVEAKAPDEDGTAIGVDAVRQLAHQMEALGASTGMLVTSGEFSSHSSTTVAPNRLIVVVDGRRLERLCVLSPADRRDELSRWLDSERRGVWLVEFAE